MMQPEPDDDALRFKIPDAATTGATFDRNHVPGSRKAEEEAAVAELLSLLPNVQARAKMQRLLNTGGRPYEVKDARHARLLTRIYEIRDADARATVIAQSLEFARTGGLDVVVALVDHLPIEDARAMILRRTKGRRPNLVLLSRDASATDFADAVATMFAHRSSYGDMIFDAMRARVPERTRPIAPEREARFARRLEKLRAAPRQTIEGIGEVQAITIMLGPVRANQ